VRGGGARINDVAINDEKHTVGTADANADGAIKVSSGKKRHVLVRSI